MSEIRTEFKEYAVRYQWGRNQMIGFRTNPELDYENQDDRKQMLLFGRKKATCLLKAIHEEGIREIIRKLADVAGVDDGRVNVGDVEGGASDLSQLFG